MIQVPTDNTEAQPCTWIATCLSNTKTSLMTTLEQLYGCNLCCIITAIKWLNKYWAASGGSARNAMRRQRNEWRTFSYTIDFIKCLIAYCCLAHQLLMVGEILWELIVFRFAHVVTLEALQKWLEKWMVIFYHACPQGCPSCIRNCTTSNKDHYIDKHALVLLSKMYVFMYLWRQTDRHTHEQTDIQTDKPTDRQIDTQTNRYLSVHACMYVRTHVHTHIRMHTYIHNEWSPEVDGILVDSLIPVWLG